MIWRMASSPFLIGFLCWLMSRLVRMTFTACMKAGFFTHSLGLIQGAAEREGFAHCQAASAKRFLPSSRPSIWLLRPARRLSGPGGEEISVVGSREACPRRCRAFLFILSQFINLGVDVGKLVPALRGRAWPGATLES